MKIVVLPQLYGNKGDQAVLHFMLEAFVDNDIKEVTAATSNPAMWEDYKYFRSANIRFIDQAWKIHNGAISKVPFKSLRYALILMSTIRDKLFIRFGGYALLRTAVVNHRFILLAKLMCYLCNRKQWQAIKQADAVITSGGHRITTYLQPDVVGHQMFSMAMVVLAQKKLYLWSQTIGGFDFKREINRHLVEKILTCAERIYVRDIKSIEELKKFPIDTSRIYNTYDSVFGLRSHVEKYRNLPPSKRESIVGISVYTGTKNRKIEYNLYIKALAMLVRKTVQDGFRVKFFPMHVKDKIEQQYFTDIITISDCAENCKIADSTIDTIEHLKQLAECKLFIGHKTHSIIFALLTATPLIAIAYHVKTIDFMKQFGIEEYGFDESQTTPDKLIGMYERILPDLDRVHNSERQKIESVSEKVYKDFSELILHLRQNAR